MMFFLALIHGLLEEGTPHHDNEYKVVGISGVNRISTVESAISNDTLNNPWIQNTTATVTGLSGGYVNILVKDEGGNMNLYADTNCP